MPGSIVVQKNNQTLRIITGEIADIYISSLSVKSTGKKVIINWFDVQVFSADFDDFASPSGADASSVEAQIATMLQIN
jgi:hypothetical protein